eukprot:1652867-Pleurochrysis_carterae.AAC.2
MVIAYGCMCQLNIPKRRRTSFVVAVVRVPSAAWCDTGAGVDTARPSGARVGASRRHRGVVPSLPGARRGDRRRGARRGDRKRGARLGDRRRGERSQKSQEVGRARRSHERGEATSARVASDVCAAASTGMREGQEEARSRRRGKGLTRREKETGQRLEKRREGKAEIV